VKRKYGELRLVFQIYGYLMLDDWMIG